MEYELESRWGPRAARSLRWALQSAVAVVLLVILPPLMLLTLVTLELRGRQPLDFRTSWESGRAVLHGVPLYAPLDTLSRLAYDHTFSPFVYPPVTAVAMVPIGLLPFDLAAALWLLLSAAAVVCSLRLLGVRDWRCHAAALGSFPVVSALGAGTFSTMLLLGVAVAWRYRDRAVICGLAVAVAVVAKLFLWPLGVWLICTRRYRSAGVALVAGPLATAGCWALVGFDSARDYPRLLSRLTALAGPNSFSLYALGVPTVGAIGLALAVQAWAWPRGERDALVAAVAAALIATPILWPHYLALLLVPLALSRPRFTPLWLAPWLLWVGGAQWSYGHPARIVPVLAVAVVVFCAAAVRRPSLELPPIVVAPTQ